MKTQSQIAFCIRDLINDYRCGIRYANQFNREGKPDKAAGEEAYAFSCRERAIRWYKGRHGLTLDKYGYPLMP